MTIGSAASLPGHGQEAPFPIFRFFRNGRLPARPAASASPPQRRLPGPALADDPPQGRFLVVADQAPLALGIQRILRSAGYRAVGPAASTSEAERLIGRCPVDGAIVDLQLQNGAAPVIVDRLAHRGIPTVCLTDAVLDADPRDLAFAPAVTKPLDEEKLIRTLESALSSGPCSESGGFYPVPPPQKAWPRVFPQL